MNKKFKAVISLLLAAALCIGMCSFAFAGDTGESSDISIDDLLALLESMTSDSSDDEGSYDSADFIYYTLNDVSVAFPADWEVSSYDDQITLMSPELTAIGGMMIMDISSIGIDLTDEKNVELIFADMGGVEALNYYEYITVCGRTAIWFNMDSEEADTEITSYGLIADLYDSMLLLSLSFYGDFGYDPEQLFATIVSSVWADGLDEDTDISAVYTGDILDAAILDVVELGDTTTDDTDSSNESTGSDKDPQAAVFDGELVLIDDDICTVTLKAVVTDDSYYPLKLKMYAENKTDLTLLFETDSCTINDYVVSGWWYENVSSGHKSNSEITFYSSDFSNNDITDIHDIELHIKVRDYDDYSTYFEDETFLIYPFGTDAPEQAPQTFDDDALVIVDNDDISMIITGFGSTDYYFNAYVYIENKTDQSLRFRVADSTAVNGFEINPYFSQVLPAGKKMNTSISWYNKDLEENYIDEIEDIELDVKISDSESWNAAPIFADIVTFEFN